MKISNVLNPDLPFDSAMIRFLNMKDNDREYNNSVILNLFLNYPNEYSEFMAACFENDYGLVVFKGNGRFLESIVPNIVVPDLEFVSEIGLSHRKPLHIDNLWVGEAHFRAGVKAFLKDEEQKHIILPGELAPMVGYLDIDLQDYFDKLPTYEEAFENKF